MKVINRNLFGYKSGRFVGKLLILGLGYFFGMKWG